ncbi:MAG: glycosyltransferase family 87 protein, partial [Chloroflexota bacterium]
METEPSPEKQKYIVLIFVGLLYSLGVAYFFANLPSARLTSDFFPRWHASRMLLTTGRSIYDWSNAAEISAVTGWPKLHQLGYYYPAYLLLFTAPLSWLPYQAAHLIWTIVGLWFLWLGIILLARLLLPDFSVNRLTVLLVLVTTSVPVFQHTQYAQFNTIGLLALVLTLSALQREQYLAAGLWAGGLLFKPQLMLVPLFFLAAWTAFKPERRRFWLGLGLAGLLLWLAAEILEPDWVFHFWQSLGSYEPIRSIIDMVWNPFNLTSLSLMAFTLWLIWRWRNSPARSVAFMGLLAWTINLNALIVPMFGMQHMVLMGLVFVILLYGFTENYPTAVGGLWWSIIGLLVAGLLAFIVPLFMAGPTGLQITLSELVYRFSLPVLSGLASLTLIVTTHPHPPDPL